jgi:uncharacterized protein YkwD
MNHWKWTLSLGLVTVILLTLAPVGWSDSPPLPTQLLPPVSVEQGEPRPDYTGCGGEIAPVVNAAYEQEVLRLVNTVRADNGLPPLKRSSALDDAARYHATDLGEDNYFDHNSYDRSGGNLVYVCAWSSRIQHYYPNWHSLAENIAGGYSTPASVMAGWMGSSGHRANILSTSNWEIGIGYYAGSGQYSRYWVQDFGRSSGVYPLIIDRDAATTESRDVSLYIYGDWQEVRLRNDDGPWSNWLPFQSEMAWTLSSGRRDHTVSAEMRAGSETATSSDTIYLDVSPPALGNLPAELRFAYSIPSAQLVPVSYALTPQNVGDDDTLSWTVAFEGTWFEATPLSGSTPGSFSITPTVFSTDTVATYSGVVTVTVLDPPETEGSPQRIELTLRVVDTPIVAVYLPLAVRGYKPSQMIEGWRR